MKLKEHTLIILLLFIMLFVCISSVSALENQTDDINDNNVIGIIESQEILNASETDDAVSVPSDNRDWYVNASAADGGNGSNIAPYNNFRSVLDNTDLQDGDTVYFAGGETYTGDGINVNLEISKQLNLLKYGSGEAVFDAQRNSRIFTITASCINITGLTFVNGKAGDGGALYFTNSISNSNINATYTNNTATRYGGANAFISASNSNITGTYTNNTATSRGGANNFIMPVLNSNIGGTYTNNTATWGGGANAFDSAINSNITGTYNHNTAKSGGANTFPMGVSNSNINGTYNHNNATEYGGSNNFGPVTNSNINGTYTNNNATQGGANYFENIVSDSNITGIYINNTSPNSIIHFQDDWNYGLDAKVTNAIFLNNKCQWEIYARTSGAIVKDSWFGNNASNYMNEPNNYNVQTDSWLFLNGTNNQNNIKFFLMRYDGTTTSEYDNTLMPEINLTITTTDGTLDKSIVRLNETVKFSRAECGISRVTAQIENATQTIEVTTGDFDVLQTIINNATSSVINLTRNYTYNQYDTITQGVLIDKNVTINGNGFTIDAKGKTRIFKVTSESINITDVTLKNGKADYGGAIYFENAISNSNINATYTNNTAKKGGANHFEYTVSNSNITGTYNNNTAKKGGANCFWDDVSNSNITGTYNHNTATNGGANNFQSSVTNSNINGTYNHNTATDYGGANCFWDDVSNSNITGTYNHNTATNGGANNFQSSVTNSNINGTYNHNTATWGGANHFGAVINSNISGTYNHNTATNGGANNFMISVSNSNINGTYTNNTATNGGANHFLLSVSNSNISGKYNHNTATNGGANHFRNVSNSNINGTYTNNTATNGGANHFDVGVSNSNIGGTYDHNNATNDGGANNFLLSVSNSNINGTYTNNNANWGGANHFGAIVSGSNIGGTYNHNTATNGGANNFNRDVSGSNIGGTYTNNTATLRGGANNFQSRVTNSNINGTYNHNTATNGGANYISESVSNSNINGTYTNNTATNGGANHFWNSISNSNITGIYINNTSPNSIIHFQDDWSYGLDAKVTNAIFLNNKCEWEIYARTQGIVVKDSWFGNNASNYMNEPNNYNVQMDTWLFLNAAVDYISFLIMNSSNVTFKLYSTNGTDVSVFDNSKFPIVNLTLTATNGDVDKTTITLDNTVKYTATETGDGSVTAKIENASYTIYFDDSLRNVNLSVSAKNITYLENEILTLTYNNIVTGKINITLKSKNYTKTIETDINQTITIAELPAGEFDVIVEYFGDNIFSNATSYANFIVKKITTEVIPDNETIDLFVDDEYKITYTLTPDYALGNISFYSSDENIVSVDPSSGDILAKDYGSAIITISFSGSENYTASNATIKVNVKKKIIISAPDVTKYYKGSERFVVTITDSKGNPLANESVDIIVNGVKYTKTTDANGSASIGLNLNSGNYTVSVVFDNTTVNATVTILSTAEGNDLVKVFRNATPYSAVFKDSEGNYLAKGTLIEYNINGVMYKKEVGENGVAKLNINLAQGTYIITAKNTVTGENCANNITVLPRIVDNNDITKFYKNDTQYTVKLIGDDGNPVGAGEVVTFNINGVFYNRTTNASGEAKLNINLSPGEYVITADYKGCKVSNNIKVLPVLSAENITMNYRDGTKFVATLVDDQGNPYPNQNVTFNINGVFYNKQTDSEGEAKLNINLMPGEYIITSSYNGSNIANKITIRG